MYTVLPHILIIHFTSTFLVNQSCNFTNCTRQKKYSIKYSASDSACLDVAAGEARSSQDNFFDWMTYSYQKDNFDNITK